MLGELRAASQPVLHWRRELNDKLDYNPRLLLQAGTTFFVYQ